MNEQSIEYLQHIVEKLFVSLKIPEEVHIDAGELLVVGDLWADIREVEDEVYTFAGFRKRKVMGFGYGEVHHHYGTREVPPEEGIIDKGETFYAIKVAENLARLWFENRLCWALEGVKQDLIEEKSGMV
jgi:hypothetical protein